MKNSICLPNVVVMNELNNLFIEMTEKSCNQRCSHCFINFPISKKVEDFIEIETIKTALNDTNMENIHCIYLTGAEPMTHPDFNSILRLCLKRTNVCICTNGSFINEKKARFLRKVQDETKNEIIFKISIDHYEEQKNDQIRYRGAFRHAIFAIKHLIKYNFTPIIVSANCENEDENILRANYKNLFSNLNLDIDNMHLQITPFHNKNFNISDDTIPIEGITDCKNGRVLSAKGIYSCPFLSSDYRGRCGSSFADYNKKTVTETEYCKTCAKSKYQIFGINFENFI